MNDGIGYCWSLFSNDMKYHFKELIGIIRKYLKKAKFDELQSVCENRFPESMRWMKLIGFKENITYEVDNIKYTSYTRQP